GGELFRRDCPDEDVAEHAFRVDEIIRRSRPDRVQLADPAVVVQEDREGDAVLPQVGPDLGAALEDVDGQDLKACVGAGVAQRLKVGQGLLAVAAPRAPKVEDDRPSPEGRQRDGFPVRADQRELGGRLARPRGGEDGSGLPSDAHGRPVPRERRYEDAGQQRGAPQRQREERGQEEALGESHGDEGDGRHPDLPPCSRLCEPCLWPAPPPHAPKRPYRGKLTVSPASVRMREMITEIEGAVPCRRSASGAICLPPNRCRRATPTRCATRSPTGSWTPSTNRIPMPASPVRPPSAR